MGVIKEGLLDKSKTCDTVFELRSMRLKPNLHATRKKPFSVSWDTLAQRAEVGAR